MFNNESILYFFPFGLRNKSIIKKKEKEEKYIDQEFKNKYWEYSFLSSRIEINAKFNRYEKPDETIADNGYKILDNLIKLFFYN